MQMSWNLITYSSPLSWIVPLLTVYEPHIIMSDHGVVGWWGPTETERWFLPPPPPYANPCSLSLSLSLSLVSLSYSYCAVGIRCRTWSATDYGPCNACGTETQIRIVLCIMTRSVVPNSNCDPATKPSQQRLCPPVSDPAVPIINPGHSGRSGRSAFGRTTLSPHHDQRCPECRMVYPNFKFFTGETPGPPPTAVLRA